MAKTETESDLKRVFRTAKIVAIGLGMLLVLLYLASGFYSVKPAQRGVVKRLGRIVNDNVFPGIHYHLPWPFETVMRPATTEIRSMTVTFGIVAGTAQLSDAELAKRESDSLMTGDENLVLASMLIQYMIDKPKSYLFKMSKGVKWLLTRIVRAACIKNAAEMTVDGILITERLEFQNNLKREIQATTKDYDLGIRIASIQIQSIQPPSSVAGAFRDVSSAREDKHKFLQQAEGERNRKLPNARSLANQEKSQAMAYANEVVAMADGDTQRFLSAWEEYRKAKNVTAQRFYLEAMEQILPKIKKVISNPKAEQLLLGGSKTRNDQMQMPMLPKDLIGE